MLHWDKKVTHTASYLPSALHPKKVMRLFFFKSNKCALPIGCEFIELKNIFYLFKATFSDPQSDWVLSLT